jgi:Tfp pilus assembly protein FimT
MYKGIKAWLKSCSNQWSALKQITEEVKIGEVGLDMSQRAKCRIKSLEDGYSMIELIMAMSVAFILAAFAVPSVRTGVNNYRLNSAVAMAKWAIQSTRFQALEKGYPYQVVFSAASFNYKIQSAPDGVTYADVAGSTTPLSAWPMTFSQDTTINFKPNGYVTATVGTSSFSITYLSTVATITVSNYGNVSTACSNSVINPTC